MHDEEFVEYKFLKRTLIPALIITVSLVALVTGKFTALIMWVLDNVPVTGYLAVIFFCTVVFGVIPAVNNLSEKTVTKGLLKEFFRWIGNAALAGVLLCIALFLMGIK